MFDLNNTIEVFSYMDKISKIEGIDIDDLKDVLKNNSKRYKLKNESSGVILVYDSESNKTKLIKCCSNYFKTNSKTCENIISEIQHEFPSLCSQCMLTCIRRYESSSLEKK